MPASKNAITISQVSHNLQVEAAAQASFVANEAGGYHVFATGGQSAASFSSGNGGRSNQGVGDIRNFGGNGAMDGGGGGAAGTIQDGSPGVYLGSGGAGGFQGGGNGGNRGGNRSAGQPGQAPGGGGGGSGNNTSTSDTSPGAPGYIVITPYS